MAALRIIGLTAAAILFTPIAALCYFGPGFVVVGIIIGMTA